MNQAQVTAPLVQTAPKKTGGGPLLVIAIACFAYAVLAGGLYLLQDHNLGKHLDEITALEKGIEDSRKGKNADDEEELRAKLATRVTDLKKQADADEIVDHHLLENTAVLAVLAGVVLMVARVVVRRKAKA